MDTIPFHFIMLAVDVLLVLGMLYWPLQKSKLWGFAGWSLFCFLGLVAALGIAKMFDDFAIQCALEGLTYHGGAFLLLSSVILFWKRRRVLSVFSLLIGLSGFTLGFDMLVWEPYNLVVEHYEIESPKVSRSIRIAFVADIQTDRIGRHERRTLELINAQKPDLVILGGDYLQTYKTTPQAKQLPAQFRQLFADIPLKAPLGVFAIGGNNDVNTPGNYEKLFGDTTVEPVLSSELFENMGADKEIGPIDLILLSCVDSIRGVGERGLTESGNFVVMAGHYPLYAINDYQHSERAPDLMLAGHTHGGQIALPFYGAVQVVVADRRGVITREFLRGMKTFSNGSRLLISRGSGMERGWAPRIRFLCPPEISIVDVIPAKTGN